MATRFPGSPFFRPLSTTADLQLSTINHVLVDPTVGAEILYLSTINNVLVDSTVAAEILKSLLHGHWERSTVWTLLGKVCILIASI